MKIKSIYAGVITGILLSAGITIALAAAAPRQALLSWGAVTTDIEGNPISGVTYNVYRGSTGDLTTKTKIVSGITALTYTDSSRPPGITDCYQVTATASAIEGGPSVERCKSYPGVAPSTVPNLTIQ